MKVEIELIKKTETQENLEMKNAGTWTGTSEVNLFDIIQEMKKKIIVIEEKIREIDIWVNEYIIYMHAYALHIHTHIYTYT